MATDYKKFIFSPDKHWGYINAPGEPPGRPVHDRAAIEAMLQFARDFKPDLWIEGGDQLDLAAISHWSKAKPLDIEALDISTDIYEYDEYVLKPIDEIMKRKGTQKEWLLGNHEMWLYEVAQNFPGLRSATELNVDKALRFNQRGWKLRDQGYVLSCGPHLGFTHGDNIRGGEAVAKKAVIDYERNIRFGHHHTHQIHTKHCAIDATQVKTGAAVGCLCTRNPLYNKKAANKWVIGFNYGYVFKDGTFTDFFPVIIDGRFAAEGRVYRG